MCFSDFFGHPLADDQPLQQRIGSQPVGTVQPCRGAFAGRKETRHASCTEWVDGNATTGVVDRRGHGNEVLGRINLRCGQARCDRRKAGGEVVDVTCVEEDVVLAELAHASRDGARDDIARSQVPARVNAGGHTVSPGIDENGSFTTDSLADEMPSTGAV